MKLKVIDASVAIKWFVAEEIQHDEALALLDQVQNTPELFAVPDLFFNEMLAVFCRLLQDAALIKKYITNLEQLGLHRLGNGSELLQTAATIATKYKITGYDAIYAASAKLIGGEWITADVRAHKRIAALKISKTL